VTELAEALDQCAAATLWTPDRRAAWWTAHRQAPAQPATAAQQPASSEMQKTVKIDMEERTP
jgi:hypothetical protein